MRFGVGKRATLLFMASPLIVLVAAVPPAWSASSTTVSVEDGIRLHNGSTGFTFREGSGVAGGTIGADPLESESWIRSAYGYAYARANLASASLHAAAESTPQWTPPTVDGSLARAVMRDILYFDVAGADRTTVTTIEVIWRQTGAISERKNVGWRSVLNLQGVGGLVFERLVGFDETPGPSIFDRDRWTLSAPDMMTPGRNLPWEVSGTLDGDFLARGFVHVVGANPELRLEAGFDTFATLGSSADFAGSAHLGFVLPANMSMRSESGLFMSAVPELNGAWLLMLGLSMLGPVRKRAQSRRAELTA